MMSTIHAVNCYPEFQHMYTWLDIS